MCRRCKFQKKNGGKVKGVIDYFYQEFRVYRKFTCRNHIEICCGWLRVGFSFFNNFVQWGTREKSLSFLPEDWILIGWSLWVRGLHVLALERKTCKTQQRGKRLPRSLTLTTSCVVFWHSLIIPCLTQESDTIVWRIVWNTFLSFAMERLIFASDASAVLCGLFSSPSGGSKPS